MIYDAIAADQPATYRQKASRDHLTDKANEVADVDKKRGDWAAKSQNIPIAIFKDWSELAIPLPDDLQKIVTLIPGSWAIQFTFTLTTPYLSKGIEAFDLLDNPIIRDKVFEVPIVPASSWKGGLRAAAITAEIMDGHNEPIKDDDRKQRILRLFGNDRGEANTFRTGRLHCFPTGFKATCCEVINPHDRARRVGTVPILLECVPANEQGTFTVLYVPFGDDRDAATCGKDLELCAKAIRDLLVEWGIGAKKSNGNGLAQSNIRNGRIMVQHILSEPLPPPFPEIAQLYLDNGGLDVFKPTRKEWREAQKATNAEADRYVEARNAHRDYQGKQALFVTAHEQWQLTQGQSVLADTAITLEDLAAKTQTGAVAIALKEN